MAVLETWFEQDLTKPVKVQVVKGNLFSQDNSGNLIGVKVFNNGAQASLAGTVSANIIRADGSTVAQAGSFSNNEVSVTLPSAAYAIPGIETIIIKISTESTVTTLAAVVVYIYSSSTDTVIDPGTILPSISALILAIDAAIASIPADYSSLWADIAPAFNASRTGGYKAGEYVTYEGDLYIFNVDHSGSWSSSDVTAVNIGDGIYDLKKNVGYYYGTLPTNTDLNSIMNFSLYGLASNRTYSHKPDVESGYIQTFKYNDSIYAQICYELDFSKVYGRRYISGAWSAWKAFNITELQYRSIVNMGVLANNSDLNDVKSFSFYSINSTQTYSNCPIASGIVQTIRYGMDTDIWMQFAFGFEDGIYMRYYLSSTWSNWERIDFNGYDREHLLNVYQPLHIAKPEVEDLDDLKENGIWGIGSTVTFDNCPIPSSGWVECYAFNSSIFWQRVWSFDDTISYTRYYIGDSWSRWFSSDGHDINNVYYAFGDSVTWGAIGGATGTQSRFNYPNCVGQLLKMTVKNKAVGGQGLIKDWDTIHTNYINGLDMSDAKLITVGWAYNDDVYYSGINFGAYTDTGDSTYIGKYYTILKEFQTKCPQAKVVLVTGYGYPDGTMSPVRKPALESQFTHAYTFADGQKTIKQMYDAMEDMCHLHGFSCVNQAKGSALNQFNADYVFGDWIHPSNNGYMEYGNHLAARIAACYGNLCTM